MLRGDVSNLSERKLMDYLTRLGYDIEIKVRPAKAEITQAMRTPVVELFLDHVRETALRPPFAIQRTGARQQTLLKT